MNRVEIYKDKQQDTELAIHISREDMYNAVMKLRNVFPVDEDFVPVCDWCDKADTSFQYFPELGHKVSCEKCAKEHRNLVKWYVEDTHNIFNSLIQWIMTYDINWSNEELGTIDEFFGSKGHNELHILSFLKKDGE